MIDIIAAVWTQSSPSRLVLRVCAKQKKAVVGAMGRKRYQRAFRGKLGTVKAYLHPKEAADGILDLSTLHNMLSLARPSGRLLRSANTFGANSQRSARPKSVGINNHVRLETLSEADHVDDRADSGSSRFQGHTLEDAGNSFATS